MIGASGLFWSGQRPFTSSQVLVQTLDGKVLSRGGNEGRVRFWGTSPLSLWKAYRQPGVHHLVEMADAFQDMTAGQRRGDGESACRRGSAQHVP